MNVRTLCLAILYFDEATGYEIKKASVEGKYSYFVDASFGSIYPALARLEADGCVTVRQELHAGKPPRKIYSITECGRKELENALAEPPGRDIFRSEFLLVAMFADILPKEKITAMIDERIESMREEMKTLQEIYAATEHAGGRWALRYGISCKSCAIAQLEGSRFELEEIAGTKSGDAAKEAAE
ncbi:MAG: PadR family transcriptional regulator [Hyphomicrobiales bacterium]|nr:MAG: PadR family transcriptional regulator [Hyphomicrobiales bacterium]